MQAQTPNPSLTRRGLLRKGSAATVATLGVGASASKLDRSPVGSAQAIGPLGAVAAAALAYLAYKGATKVLGDNQDYSNYTGADALHGDIWEGVHEMQSADERVMTSIENNITNSQNIALAKGKAAVIEEMNAGNPEADAQTAMQNAIDSYYATIQENILNHYNSQIAQLHHHHEQIEAHADLALGDVYDEKGYNYGSADPEVAQSVYDSLNISDKTADVDLLDGSTAPVEIRVYEYSGSTGNHRPTIAPWVSGFPNLGTRPQYPLSISWDEASVEMYQAGDEAWKWTMIPQGGDYQDAETLTAYSNGSSKLRVASAWDAVINERDDVNSQLSGFVSDVYAQYSADEIPTEDLVDPITAATELDQNYDGYQTRAAHAAMLGIPTSAGNSLILEVEDPDDGSTALVEADLYTDHSPDGGFQVGNTYDPSTWSEPAYIAYRHTETNQDGEVVDETQAFEQLEMPFTIKDATDADGNSIDSFSPEPKVNQTSDVATLEEELAQIRETQIEMQEEAQEPDGPSGGGGGSGGGFNWDQFSIAGVPGVAVVAIGGLLAYAGITTGN